MLEYLPFMKAIKKKKNINKCKKKFPVLIAESAAVKKGKYLNANCHADFQRMLCNVEVTASIRIVLSTFLACF